MTTILWCWAVGMLLPYVWAGASVPFRNQQFGKIDNDHPRLQAERMEGQGARAVGAQANAWEALIIFSAANGAAIWAGLDPTGSWSTFAMVWVAVRVLHGVFYILGQSMLRGASFIAGTAMSIAILVLAFQA